jgi:hypothetical protein
MYIYYSDPFAGVEAALKVQDKDQIEVKGEGIDIIKLATVIRKKSGACRNSKRGSRREERREKGWGASASGVAVR